MSISDYFDGGWRFLALMVLAVLLGVGFWWLTDQQHRDCRSRDGVWVYTDDYGDGVCVRRDSVIELP